MLARGSDNIFRKKKNLKKFYFLLFKGVFVLYFKEESYIFFIKAVYALYFKKESLCLYLVKMTILK